MRSRLSATVVLCCADRGRRRSTDPIAPPLPPSWCEVCCWRDFIVYVTTKNRYLALGLLLSAVPIFSCSDNSGSISQSGSGGSSSLGGTSGSGGAKGSGGTTGNGGSSGSGGSGGAKGSGGTTGNGGSSTSGGSSGQGGAASGGSPGSGGAPGVGGSSPPRGDSGTSSGTVDGGIDSNSGGVSDSGAGDAGDSIRDARGSGDADASSEATELLHYYGRWNRLADRAITVNSGSHVTAQFSGTGISAKFDTTLNHNAAPNTRLAH